MEIALVSAEDGAVALVGVAGLALAVGAEGGGDVDAGTLALAVATGAGVAAEFTDAEIVAAAGALGDEALAAMAGAGVELVAAV